MNKLEEKFEHIMSIVNAPEAAKQCAEIAEQECIGFAEWVDENDFYIGSDNLWQKINYGEGLTSIQLFQLYLKSKENE